MALSSSTRFLTSVTDFLSLLSSFSCSAILSTVTDSTSNNALSFASSFIFASFFFSLIFGPSLRYLFNLNKLPTVMLLSDFAEVRNFANSPCCNTTTCVKSPTLSSVIAMSSSLTFSACSAMTSPVVKLTSFAFETVPLEEIVRVT